MNSTAYSTVLAGSMCGPLGLPIKQFLLFLLDPVGVVVGFLDVNARLL